MVTQAVLSIQHDVIAFNKKAMIISQSLERNNAGITDPIEFLAAADSCVYIAVAFTDIPEGIRFRMFHFCSKTQIFRRIPHRHQTGSGIFMPRLFLTRCKILVPTITGIAIFDSEPYPQVVSQGALGDTGGRPVGLQVMPDGSVIIADALKGLLRLLPDGSVEVLASEFEGRPILFADDLDISSEGVVWFSDASQRFSIDGFMLDLLEASRTGRLMSYNLATGEIQSHLEGLFFANGVALGPDETFVLVNETVTGRVHRLWLKGERAGSSDIFIDQIPAMVDNISFNGRDTFWVASPNPRDALDALADKPSLRKLVGGLPAWVSGSLEEHFSMVSAFDSAGNLIKSFRDPDARLNQITSVNECDGKLIMGSLISNNIGVLELAND